MVKDQIICTMVGFILTLVFALEIFGQKGVDYPALSKYSKWSIVAGPVLYNKAGIEPQYGNYSFDNLSIPTYSYGLEYDFFPDRQWSMISGLWVVMEPGYKAKYTIFQRDLYSNFPGDFSDGITGYTIVSFSLPLMISLKKQIAEDFFWNLRTGLKAMYYPPGELYCGIIFHNEDDSESREMFGLNLHSQDFSFYGSFVIGTGVSYSLGKVLVKANLLHVMNFQNTIEGEYQFANLLTSPPTRGNYELSGNYWSLQLAVSIPRFKRKWDVKATTTDH